MSKKPRPFSFSDPEAIVDAPPPAADDEGLTLDMPQIPDGLAQPLESATPSAGALAHTYDNLPGRPSQDAHSADGGMGYMVAVIASVLWAGGLAAFAMGYRSHLGPLGYGPFAVAVLAILAIAPLGLIWVGAYALQQGLRLLGEARRMQALSDQILGPAALAAAQTGSTVDAIRLEVESALQTISLARGQLQLLRHGLAEDTQRLIDAAAGSQSAGGALVRTLGVERDGFSALSDKLNAQAVDIGAAITRHARMVAETSDLAQALIHEAEAALAARAADLAAAAGEASDAARMAGDDLSRQASRLEAAGVTVTEQVQEIEAGLGQQRAALVSLAHTMRADQEDLAVQFETQRAQVLEIISQANDESQQVSAASARGAEVLSALIAQAADQLRDMSEQAEAERDLLGGQALRSLGAFSEAAAFERRALEDETQRAIEELGAAAEAAHKAAEAASETAKRKVQDLSEAAFAAGQKADAAFEDRLSEARGLIEQSADLVDQAGARSVAKLDQGVTSARQALDGLQHALADIEARTARLPEDAAIHGQQVRTALESATDALLRSARTASAELQSIDNAFQERVKRNYEMLSEAVRLMGVMGGGASARASGATVPAARPTPAPAPVLRPRIAEPVETQSALPEPEPAPRRRLKLTPTESDEDLKTVFEPAAEARAVEADTGGGWSWSDILSALDGEEIDDDGDLERFLTAEVRGLGIDMNALLSDTRINELAKLLEVGDLDAVRDMVHRLAPAAIRKLVRHILSDTALRAKANRFIQRQTRRIKEMVRRGQAKAGLARALNAPGGRVFLIFDAAVSELG